MAARLERASQRRPAQAKTPTRAETEVAAADMTYGPVYTVCGARMCALRRPIEQKAEKPEPRAESAKRSTSFHAQNRKRVREDTLLSSRVAEQRWPRSQDAGPPASPASSRR